MVLPMTGAELFLLCAGFWAALLAILFAVVRPGIRGRDGETWWAIARYGVSLAALNLTFFEAIQRLPMGIAVTFAFLAPLAMALAGSCRRRYGSGAQETA